MTKSRRKSRKTAPIATIFVTVYEDSGIFVLSVKIGANLSYVLLSFVNYLSEMRQVGRRYCKIHQYQAYKSRLLSKFVDW